MAKSSGVVVITIPTWRKFNPRSDVKSSSWFRLEWKMIEDPDFYDFSHEEFKAWIYVMAQASKKNSDTIRLNYEHAAATAKLSKKGIDSALEKLSSLQLVTVDVTDAVRARDVHDTSANATRRDETVRDETRRDRMPELAELWNTVSAVGLPKVRDMSRSSTRRKACEERWREKPDANYWTEVITRINSSPFCLGSNPRGWLADIDFLARPDTHAKVLEGKYDPLRASAAIPKTESEGEAALREIAEWKAAQKGVEYVP